MENRAKRGFAPKDTHWKLDVFVLKLSTVAETVAGGEQHSSALFVFFPHKIYFQLKKKENSENRIIYFWRKKKQSI
jgi:hypothetical protein